jgi:hypothetical protein
MLAPAMSNHLPMNVPILRDLGGREVFAWGKKGRCLQGRKVRKARVKISK